MYPIEQIKTNFNNLTQVEQKAANCILENPQQIINLSLSKFSKESGASNTAIIRLCQKLGYAGYSEFIFAMRQQLLSGEVDGIESAEGDSIRNLLSTYITYINQIPAYVTAEQLKEIAHSIHIARRVCIWGINRTYLPVQHLSSRLGRIGILNFCTDDVIEMQDQCDCMRVKDVCVLYTLLGRGSKLYPSLARQMRENGVTVILVTMNPKLPLAKDVDYVVTLPRVSNESRQNFYEDQILVYLFNELLLAEISRETGRPGK